MAPSQTDNERAAFPHCDSDVLHAPGTCEFCDVYPDKQQERIASSINFTGENDPNKTQCPAEARRPIGMINRWPGNTTEGYPVPTDADACARTVWTAVDCAKAIDRSRDFVREGTEAVLSLQPRVGESYTITFPVDVWLDLATVVLEKTATGAE